MAKAASKKQALSRSRKTASAGSKESPPGAGAAPIAHRWTFLTNHAHVLILLHSDSDIVLREVAARIGITERAVQRIIQDLEDEGFIQRERVGRKNHYRVLTSQPLRHPIESHRKIGDLLRLIAGD